MKGEVTAPLVWIFFVYVMAHGYVNSVIQTVLGSVNFNPGGGTVGGNTPLAPLFKGGPNPSTIGVAPQNQPGVTLPGGAPTV